nr:integrase, catalytic region, zinc finger, CCHC-type, peptidase aspartic, catalytic [Tanacetum cinerariifolium]
QCNIYKNVKLRTQLFKMVSDQKDNNQDTITSNSVSKPPVSKGVNNAKVIAPDMFRICPDKIYMEAKKVPNTVSASSRTKPITVSQPSVITKKNVNFDLNGLSSTGLDNTKTRRPQPRSNTKNDRVPSASKSSRSITKEVKVEEHHRNLLLSKKNKHILSACNNSKIDSQDVISKVICAMYRSTNLYTINLHEMASASPICLMARASSTKSWLWHQRLSHLNFDTINDLARNDHVTCLPKFKYHKEHLCPSCEQGKSKRASHPPKPVPNSRQRLHLLHMDLCRPMRIASIHEKRYILVIVDDYSRYTWRLLNNVDFSRAPLFLWAEAIATACFTQNRSIIHCRFNKTPYELINGREPDISFLHVFGALCYPKNDREDIRKLGAKGDIGFFIGYSADSCAYRIYNRQTKKIMETMNVSFDELSTMAFKQCSSKPGLQCMTSGQISSGLALTYVPSTITKQQPTEGELDLLFEAMYDDYFGGQPSATVETVSPAQ